MNYIGSKQKLLPFLMESICSVTGQDLEHKIFCDLFAGTGMVSRAFKSITKQVICNDFEYFSYVLNRNYIGNCKQLYYEPYIQKLNELDVISNGFIYNHYCMGSESGRQYFSNLNGMKIDCMRKQIELWWHQGEFEEDMYFFLLASLIESADKVANTASVYGAYLKEVKQTARQPLLLTPATFEVSHQENLVFNEDSNQLIHNISGDILYLDPPYNARQYGSNYHILNTIALYDQFEPKGKTGLRNYQKSDYCSKQKVSHAFEEIIQNAQFKYIFLSYNNEGLMPVDQVKSIMQKYGHYDIAVKDHSRFRADKEDKRNHKADRTQEFVHILEKT
ncbi:DNA adenine methylase [Francisellaceae bacterium]|nr:DNA adenine methylase [Francisellaceae bacterium]